MEAEFWIERWKASEIGFHQAQAHEMLTNYWPKLGLAPGSAVFVPLCGKSLDMVWLAEQGHKVIGVELSPLAVDAFFSERGLVPETQMQGTLVVKRAGPYSLYCGDLFELRAEMLTDVAAVYDRAALVAMPPTMQTAYAGALATVLPSSAPILLVSLAYPPGQIAGPPFATPLVQIAALFGPTHEIFLLESRDGLEQSQNLKARGVTMLEEAAYVLRRKS